MTKNEYRASKRWPFHISCGGAVYRAAEHGPEFLLLYRRPGFKWPEESWHLPKGTLHREETLEACALREVAEEAGVLTEVEGYLGAMHGSWVEPSGRQVDKSTHYFLLRCTGDAAAAMDDEHDRAEWVDAGEAIQRLARMPKQEDQIIRRAVLLLALQSVP